MALLTVSLADMSAFSSQVPHASKEASSIPDDLWVLLVREQPDWLSKRWRPLICSFCKTVLLPLHTDAINLASVVSCPSVKM